MRIYSIWKITDFHYGTMQQMRLFLCQFKNEASRSLKKRSNDQLHQYGGNLISQNSWRTKRGPSSISGRFWQHWAAIGTQRNGSEAAKPRKFKKIKSDTGMWNSSIHTYRNTYIDIYIPSHGKHIVNNNNMVYQFQTKISLLQRIP